MERYLCIHCHFYQPPRENPWLEEIEYQDSAYPFHDWNQRITSECYAPNAASRILDDENFIQKIVNNYANVSFNFGPTLLSWMEQNRRRIYECILEADRQSRERFGGHGSALAQAYNHMILPLANARDRRTQVGWGLADFRRRFGREPEGMWLPETACDVETLEELAAQGIKFTILAPHQAMRVRNGAERPWRDVSGASIDPTVPYRVHLPGGGSIVVFFYDGPISRAVAFEGLLSNGEHFAQRLMSGFSDARGEPQLMHISTDGETYGHHHRHGDMALAYAVDYVEKNGLARITNYGEYLEQHPPQQEAEIANNTSWSCAHGVERWRSDCGCNTGGNAGWRQHWREPLRNALDFLRDELGPRYEEKARAYLRDPWAARDAYVGVVLDRSPENVDLFLRAHAARQLSEEETVTVLKLLEIQRHLMLMYTSCGWFFDELSGIETVQVIMYAGRAIQLAQELFGDHLEERFLGALANAKSNLPEQGDGARIYDRYVKPAMIDLPKVGAHYAISSLFERYGEHDSIYCYVVDREDYRVVQSGRASLAVGRARIQSRITREAATLSFGVLHLGDHNLNAGVREFRSNELYRALVNDVTSVFDRSDLPEVIRLLDRHFEGITYSLKSLFTDEQRQVVGQILNNVRAEAEASYSQIYDHHAALMRFLTEIAMPLPQVFRITAEFVVNASLRRAFTEDDPDIERIETLLETAERDQVKLDGPGLGYALSRNLERQIVNFLGQPENLPLLERLSRLIELATRVPFEINLWRVQNVYWEMLHEVYPRFAARNDELGREWVERFEGLAGKLRVRLPQKAPLLQAA